MLRVLVIDVSWRAYAAPVLLLIVCTVPQCDGMLAGPVVRNVRFCTAMCGRSPTSMRQYAWS